jgi:predicted nucleotidyltransferase
MQGTDRLRQVAHTLAEDERTRIVERIVRASDAGPDGIVAVYLHGSFGRNEPFRDVDLALLPDATASAGWRRAAEEVLDLALRPYDADIRWLDEAPVHFRYRVIAEGRVLWESDPVARADFVERTLLEHFDTAWMREELLRGALGLDR